MVRNADWQWNEASNLQPKTDWLRPRVQDLLPWADPYIAALIASLEGHEEQGEIND